MEAHKHLLHLLRVTSCQQNGTCQHRQHECSEGSRACAVRREGVGAGMQMYGARACFLRVRLDIRAPGC